MKENVSYARILSKQKLMDILLEQDEEGILDTFDFYTLQHKAITFVKDRQEDIEEALLLEEEEHPTDTAETHLLAALKPILDDLMHEIHQQREYLMTLPADGLFYLKKRAMLLSFVRPIERTEAYHDLREEVTATFFALPPLVASFRQDARAGEALFLGLVEAQKAMHALEDRIFVTRFLPDTQKEAFLACLLGGTQKDFLVLRQGRTPKNLDALLKDLPVLKQFLQAAQNIPYPRAGEVISEESHKALCRTLLDVVSTSCTLVSTYGFMAYLEPLVEPLSLTSTLAARAEASSV